MTTENDTQETGPLTGGAGHFSAEQVDKLNSRLDRSLIKTREQSGQRFIYLESYNAINQANSLFGYGSWSMTVDRVQPIASEDGTFYAATVTLSVTAPDGSVSHHQDVGGAAASRDKVAMHETAYKAAVSDAMKRAMRHFGEQFANELYAKDYTQARAAEERDAQGQATTQPATARRTAPVQATRATAPAPRQSLTVVRAPASTEEMRAEVSRYLAADAEALTKMPKAVADMGDEELSKALSWLSRRARALTGAVDPIQAQSDREKHSAAPVAHATPQVTAKPDPEQVRERILVMLAADPKGADIMAARGVDLSTLTPPKQLEWHDWLQKRIDTGKVGEVGA